MPETGFQWEVEPGLAFQQLFDAYAGTMFTTGARIMERRSAEMLMWAKENAPWTDRTGDARNLLHTVLEQNPQVLGSISIRHGVSYGVWLELAYGGKWAIITKVIDRFGPIIWKDIQNMMNLKIVAGAS